MMSDVRDVQRFVTLGKIELPFKQLIFGKGS